MRGETAAPTPARWRAYVQPNIFDRRPLTCCSPHVLLLAHTCCILCLASARQMVGEGAVRTLTSVLTRASDQAVQAFVAEVLRNMARDEGSRPVIVQQVSYALPPQRISSPYPSPFFTSLSALIVTCILRHSFSCFVFLYLGHYYCTCAHAAHFVRQWHSGVRGCDDVLARDA